MSDTAWLPLFPLKTVLFPGGVLPLRVFETRYVDMVRACMKTESPFGVVAIRTGTEVGKAAEPYAVGTHAHIVEWDMAELGVLLLQTRGGSRFRILETRLQNNQLLEARTETLQSDETNLAEYSLIMLDGSRTVGAKCCPLSMTRSSHYSKSPMIASVSCVWKPICSRTACCRFLRNSNECQQQLAYR
jgi:ATP-dependent Lon protease